MAFPPQGIFTPPRTATLLVAAWNASPRSQAQADYLCDGVDDQVEIQAALDALPESGGRVRLSEGHFYLGGAGHLLQTARPYTTIGGQGPGEGGGTRLIVQDGVDYDSVLRLRHNFCCVEDLAIHGNRASTTGTRNGIDLSGVIDQVVERIITWDLGGSDIRAHFSGGSTFWMHFIRCNWLEGSPGGTPCIHYSWDPAVGTAADYNLRDCLILGNVIGSGGIRMEPHPTRAAGYTYQDIKVVGNFMSAPLDTAGQCRLAFLGNSLIGGAPQVILDGALDVVILGNPGLSGAALTNITNLEMGHHPALDTHVSVSTSYTAALTDRIIGVDSSGGPVTITLPSAALAARCLYTIKDEGGAAGLNNITVATEGAELIDGAATLVIATSHAAVSLYSDGSSWFVF